MTPKFTETEMDVYNRVSTEINKVTFARKLLDDSWKAGCSAYAEYIEKKQYLEKWGDPTFRGWLYRRSYSGKGLAPHENLAYRTQNLDHARESLQKTVQRCVQFRLAFVNAYKDFYGKEPADFRPMTFTDYINEWRNRHELGV